METGLYWLTVDVENKAYTNAITSPCEAKTHMVTAVVIYSPQRLFAPAYKYMWLGYFFVPNHQNTQLGGI